MTRHFWAFAVAGLLITGAQAGAITPTSAVTYDAGSLQAPFLALGVSARAVAMGEAFTSVADDASAAILNPGGLGQISSFDAVAQYAVMGDGMSHNIGALALPVGPGAVGIGINMMQLGSYDVRDSAGALLSTQSLTDIAGVIGYGMKNPAAIGRGWSGIGVEAVKTGTGSSSIAGNLGTVLPFGGEYTFGLALQHLGGKADGFGLPAVAKAGVSYVWTGVLRGAVEGGYGIGDKIPFAGVGVEYSPLTALAFRVGYRRQLSDQGITGLTGVTAGAGFRISSLSVDAAYAPYGDLAPSNVLVSLSYHSGPWVPQPTEEQLKEEQAKEASAIVNVAVMDLSAENVSSGDAAVISDILRSELVRVESINVLERQNMQKILAEHAFQQTGCTSEECAVKLGKLLNVQRMIAGSLGKLGSDYYVNVRVIDIQTGKVVWSDSTEAGTESALAKKIPSLANRLGKKVR